MFKITRTWLNQYSRTGHSGWNAKQLAILGISWPPKAGWIYQVCSQFLEDEQKKEFEALAGKSQEGVKIDAGKANMATNPVYRTWPDGKGGWFGEWVGEARYPWTSEDCSKSVHSPKAKDLLSND